MAEGARLERDGGAGGSALAEGYALPAGLGRTAHYLDSWAQDGQPAS